jgi:hypothetical protein
VPKQKARADRSVFPRFRFKNQPLLNVVARGGGRGFVHREIERQHDPGIRARLFEAAFLRGFGMFRLNVPHDPDRRFSERRRGALKMWWSPATENRSNDFNWSQAKEKRSNLSKTPTTDG